MEGTGKVELEDAINFRELLAGGDVTFSVKDTGDEDGSNYEAPESIFNTDDILNNVRMDALCLEEDHSSEPFESIKEKMTSLNASGTIMKKIIKPGVGERISPDAFVRIHYAGYFEFNEVPFDSSYLRGKFFEFVLGCSGVVPGLDMAVASMRDKEKAEFILHPSVAFGKLGCPPRIPPNAEVLFIVEVMSWRVGSEAAVARAESNPKGEKAWEECRAAFRLLVREGISLYNEQKFNESKAKLMKGKQMIENCHLKNEEEEEDFKSCMYKVSINLAMVLNNLHSHGSFPPLAITNCKEALHIKPNCGKAELQWGLALISLGDLDRAQKHLLVAKKRLPGSSEVARALEKLEGKKKSEKEVEGGMWKRAFNPKAEVKVEDKEKELSAFEETIRLQLQEFFSSDLRELTLPAAMTPKEKEAVTSIVESLNLDIRFLDKSIRVSKP